MEYLRGATIESLTEKAESYLKSTCTDQVYFFAGVNNLTDKHLNGRVTGKYTETSNLVEMVKEKLDTARKTLILCHVIGLDIHVYNKNPDENVTHIMQLVVDEGIPLLNIAIDSMNMNYQVKGPWLSDTNLVEFDKWKKSA